MRARRRQVRGGVLRVSGALVALVAVAWLGVGCDSTSPRRLPPRTFRMGFSAIPPRPDSASFVNSILMWRQRADAAIFHIQPQWDSLLAGRPADVLVRRDPLPLADYYRSQGFDVAVTVDLTDGLDRSAGSPALEDAGRSLAEPEVQQLARSWIVALDTLVRPRWLGLAAETNLIRAAAPAALYGAVVRTANDAAVDVRAVDPAATLYVSFQVEVAWGALGGGGYQGIQADLVDFPFAEAIGFSSYPHLGGYAAPESLPLDYYARLTAGTGLPALVVEGGWTSASVESVSSSPELQARYVIRHGQLLDEARAAAVFQLTFTDLDLSAIPVPPGSVLPLFASADVGTPRGCSHRPDVDRQAVPRRSRGDQQGRDADRRHERRGLGRLCRRRAGQRNAARS